MKFKILTDRIPAYKKGEVVDAHEKATNFKALNILVSNGEAENMDAPVVKKTKKSKK